MRYVNYSKILFFLCFAFIIGCELPTENQQGNSLYGTWQLKVRSGGFAGISDTLDISEDNFILSFHENKSFSTFYNDTLRLRGSFEVNKEMTIFSSDSLETINYLDYNSDLYVSKDVILYLSTDTLYLSNNMVDDFLKLYTRVE